MKLFLWRKLESLRDEIMGVACAMARNVEEARRIVLDDARRNQRGFLEAAYISIERGLQCLSSELLATEPEVFDGPAGFTVVG